MNHAEDDLIAFCFEVWAQFEKCAQMRKRIHIE